MWRIAAGAADPRHGPAVEMFFTKSLPPPAQAFHGGPDGWQDEQFPDGTVVFTSPTGRVYRNSPASAELFPQMRGPCAEPVPRKRSRRREKSARTSLARSKLTALRPINAEQQRINRARRQRSIFASGATTCARRCSCSRAAGPVPVRGVHGSTTRSRTCTSPPTGYRHPQHRRIRATTNRPSEQPPI